MPLTTMPLTTYLLVITGFFGFFGLAFYAYKQLNRGWSFQVLFRDFKSKIYMTVSLGTVFLCVYLTLVTVSMLLSKKWGSEIITLFSAHKVEMIYAGLAFFVLISLSIIIARMIVKYFYLRR